MQEGFRYRMRERPPYVLPTLAILTISLILTYIVYSSQNGNTWLETGYPTKKTEGWRIRVCKIHQEIFIRDPYLPPKPLHAILNIDATKEPFKSFEHSSHAGQRNHKAVRQIIAEALHQQLLLISRRRNLEQKDDAGKEMGENYEDWVSLMERVAAVLLDDDPRNNYQRHFVPALTGGVWDFMSSEASLLETKLEQLKKLCA
ncbi:hypothetical protein FAUST_295 [Fusarium austroamericanum]|uniref:Uncharacterized protein n=1 Tax=Fusarium austroamericanum TaxID=282268 RepID=A0AAN6CAM6_FUSAU|nr:hypothetical protein FAUST_295 [Fusarium austroamericanum]